jgi:hypothetical protein
MKIDCQIIAPNKVFPGGNREKIKTDKRDALAIAWTFMSYIGLVPSEYSSGNKRKQGGITKTGNGHIRKLLTEAAWHYTRPVKISLRLAERRVGTSETVISYADRALNRLHGKYVKLLCKGKSKQAAVTAVARELSGFLWGVMTEVA